MNARKRFRISSSIAVFTFGIVIVLSIIFTFFVGFTSELASNVKALLFSTLAIIFVVSLIFFLIGIIKMNRNRRERKKRLEEQIQNFINEFPGKIREIKNSIDINFNDARIEWFKTNMAFRSLIDNILGDIRVGEGLVYKRNNNSESYLREYFSNFTNNNKKFTIDIVSDLYGFKNIKNYREFKNDKNFRLYPAEKWKFYCFVANYFMAYILKNKFNLMPVKDTIQTIEDIHSNLQKNVEFTVNYMKYSGKIENIFSYVNKRTFYDLFNDFNEFNTLEKLFELIFTMDHSDDSLKKFFILQKLYKEYEDDEQSRNNILNFIKNLPRQGKKISSIDININIIDLTTDAREVVLSSGTIRRSLPFKQEIEDFINSLDDDILDAVNKLKSREQIGEIQTDFYGNFFEFLFETIKSFIEEIVSAITDFKRFIKENLENDFNIFKEKLDFIKLFLAKATNLSELKEDLSSIKSMIRKVVKKIYERFNRIKQDYSASADAQIRQNLANSFSEITQYYNFFIHFLYEDIRQNLQRITGQMRERGVNPFEDYIIIYQRQNNNNIDNINIFRKIDDVIDIINQLPRNLKLIYDTLAERNRNMDEEVKALIETKEEKIDYENLLNKFERQGSSLLLGIADRIRKDIESSLRLLSIPFPVAQLGAPLAPPPPAPLAPPPSQILSPITLASKTEPKQEEGPKQRTENKEEKKEKKEELSNTNLTLPEDLKVKVENNETEYKISDQLRNLRLNKDCRIEKGPKIIEKEENKVQKLYEIRKKEPPKKYSIEVQNIEAFGNISEFQNILFLVGDYKKLEIYKNTKLKIPEESEFENLKNNTLSSLDKDNNTYMYISSENLEKIRKIITEKKIIRIHYVNDTYDNPVLNIGIEELLENKRSNIYFNIPVSEYDKQFAVCILNELISIHRNIKDKKDYEYILGNYFFNILCADYEKSLI